MVDQLVRPRHVYGGGAPIINQNAYDRHLNDNVNVVIQPYTHYSTITKSIGNFLDATFNNETIDLTGMIYRTIVVLFYLPFFLSSLSYFDLSVGCFHIP